MVGEIGWDGWIGQPMGAAIGVDQVFEGVEQVLDIYQIQPPAWTQSPEQGPFGLAPVISLTQD